MKHTITEYLDRRFSEMEDDGFSLLAQVPSSEAKRFLSGYAALSGVQRALFRKAATARGALWWGFEYDRGAKTPDAQFFDKFTRMTPYPDWACLEKVDTNSGGFDVV